MREHLLFYVLFFSQVLLISGYLSRKISQRIQYILDHYSPEEYPKLYPVPPKTLRQGLATFKMMNMAILFIGLAVGITSWFLPSKELLGWDSMAVLALYFLLQYVPVFFTELSSKKYVQLIRNAYPRSTRRASLKPRRLFDFVSPGLVALALLLYVGFVALVVYINQDPFDGFAGLWNLAWVTVLYLFFASIIFWNLRGKKRDPHQDDEDRFRQIGIIINQQVLAAIVSTVFLALMLLLPGWGVRDQSPLFMTLFFQATALMAVYSLPIESMNFEGYRQASS